MIVDPDCSQYYFHSLDETTKHCVLVSSRTYHLSNRTVLPAYAVSCTSGSKLDGGAGSDDDLARGCRALLLAVITAPCLSITGKSALSTSELVNILSLSPQVPSSASTPLNRFHRSARGHYPSSLERPASLDYILFSRRPRRQNFVENAGFDARGLGARSVCDALPQCVRPFQLAC